MRKEKDKKKKSNRRPFFRFIKAILRIFIRRPRIEYLGDKPDEPCIFLCNHNAAIGPATYELYYPHNMHMWGTYEMCEGFKSRYRYLKDVYLPQKKHFSKAASALIAPIIAPIMGAFYKGMQIYPTYPDMRLAKTINRSVDNLIDGQNILVLPEDSSNGYNDELRGFFGGFWLLAKRYHDVTGKDIKIVSMYFSRKLNKLVVDQPKSYLETAEKYSRPEATQYFMDCTNALFHEHVEPYLKKKKTEK